MEIFKKEKRVRKLILEHVDKTSECVRAAIDAVNVFLSGDHSEAAVANGRVNTLESEADSLLRGIRDLLYSGAYLPLIRGDIYRLMTAVDLVANAAESCYDFFAYQEPQIPETYRADFTKVLELTEETLREFERALRIYFKPKGKLEFVREHSQRVSKLESLVDDVERALTAQIFESSLDKSEKIHLRRALTHLALISDRIEDATDELEMTAVKSIL